MGIKKLFSGIADEKVGWDGEYLGAGQYLIRIDEVKYNDGRKNESFIISGTVVHVYRDANGKLLGEDGFSGHKPGNSVSQVCVRSSDYFLKDVKKFIMAATGTAAEEVTEEDTLEMVGFDAEGEPTGEPGPLDGRFFTMECNNPLRASKKLKDDDGNPVMFPNVNWVRRVPCAEVLATISPNALDRFYVCEGENMLEKLAEAGL